MIKLYMLIICALFSTGCATPSITRDKIGFTYTADAGLNHYITEFMSDCRIYLGVIYCNPAINLSVTIAPLDENTLGLCTVYPYVGKRTVEINSNIIGKYNERLVVYHELFHCILNLPHYDNEMDIMNAYESENSTQEIYLNWISFVRKTFLRALP